MRCPSLVDIASEVDFETNKNIEKIFFTYYHCLFRNDRRSVLITLYLKTYYDRSTFKTRIGIVTAALCWFGRGKCNFSRKSKQVGLIVREFQQPGKNPDNPETIPTW